MIKQFKVSTSSSFTSRDSHSMENYLREIHSNPSLTSEQESDLFKRYKESGDQVALKKIVHANLKFVVSVAKSYQTKNITLSDLISEGNIGLIKAATKYDETLGYKFISYAVWWIRQSIMHYLSETQRMVRLPNNKSQEFGKIKKFNDSFYKKNGFLPTGDVICNALELSEISYSKIMEFSTDFKSLTQTLDSGSGEEFCLEDLVESNFFDAPDKQSNVSDMKIGVKYLMSLLNNREIDVIKADFEFLDEQGNIEITRDQINEKYGLTETRINQIKQQALAKIRSKFGIKKFKMLLA